ncbi:hypothetical protein [Spirosoma harenae]
MQKAPSTSGSSLYSRATAGQSTLISANPVETTDNTSTPDANQLGWTVLSYNWKDK